MTTLVRARPVDHDAHDIRNSVPAPFPVHHILSPDDDVLDDRATEPVDYDDPGAARAILHHSAGPYPYPSLQVVQCRADIQASVAAVQHSCLMTLANVLSLSSPLDMAPHSDDSEQPSGAAISFNQVLAESPLSCLVHALHARNGHSDQYDHPLSESALLSHLRDLVDAVVPSLDRRDARLAQAIVALLLDLEQLPASLALISAMLVPRPPSSQVDEIAAGSSSESPYATITSLRRQLFSLQPSLAPTFSGSRPTPEQSVRTALFWARIDEQLDNVVSLCKARASSPSQHDVIEPFMAQPSESQSWNNHPHPSLDDSLPPDYDSEFHRSPYEHPPSYVAGGYLYASSEENPPEEKRSAQQDLPEKVPLPASVLADTEMTTGCDHSISSSSLDFDGITHAIERLYAVAPQLANQRVELRREKVMQMERAKQAKGKAGTLVDVTDPELDKILDLLGRASAREIPDQSVVIDPRRTTREVGTADIEEQRRKYFEHLVHRTSAGRLHSQDAIPSFGHSSSSPSKAGVAGQDRNEDQNSEAQPEGRSSRDGKRASCSSAPKSGSTLELPSERLRSRSLSAPHLTWLRPREKLGSATGAKEGSDLITRTASSDPKSLSHSTTPKSVRSLSGRLRGASKSRPPSTDGEDANSGMLDIAYVAEHHETLKHVLAFVSHVSPLSPAFGGVPLVEVVPGTSSSTHGNHLSFRLGDMSAPPLALPVPVDPGPKSVLIRSDHWEIKASCYKSGVLPKESEDVSLLPASELASLSALSYTCSSCSLPLVPHPPRRYRDLPSEHWEELIDAWMCHPEGQTLAKTGMSGGDGNAKGSGFWFWPTRDEALVGGSYILFHSEAIVGANIKCIGLRERGGQTRLARCLCGAILGKQHERRQEEGSVSRMYRLFKYAIRPVSATSEVARIPMSAFVLHDMLEHVQAHATYRFVLSDEEDDKPRLLIWLFKPRIRISYMLAAPALLPKSGTVDASKVLYKVLGPTSSTSDFKEILNKYPGFPQAEYLFYPMDVCRKLAALLMESTASYPENMRTMTGLDVGWLTMV